MQRIVAFFLCLVAVGVLVRPASAVEPLPPSSTVIGLQDARPYLAPLAACQVNVLLTRQHALLKTMDAGATVSSIISLMGLPADPSVHNLALITLAFATHLADKERADQRAVMQPLEKAAATAAASIAVDAADIDSAADKLPAGTCAGLAPTVVPTPNVYVVSNENAKFAVERKAIAVYLTPSMAARLARIATSLQSNASLTTSAAVIAAANSGMSGVVVFTNQQMALLEYVAIQEALDARLATGHVTTGDLAFVEALKSIQANITIPLSDVQNMVG